MSKQNERGVEKTGSDCLDPLRGDIHSHGKMEIRDGRREQTHLWQTDRARMGMGSAKRDIILPSTRGNEAWDKLLGTVPLEVVKLRFYVGE